MVNRQRNEADLEDVYQTERHLLYVACTRARERLLVTAVGAGSEFPGGHGIEGRRAGLAPQEVV